MKFGKRLISLFLAVLMATSVVTAVDFSAFADSNSGTNVDINAIAKDNSSIAIGDYITLGTYYGEPILWRCVDIDENGPLMLSDKILCLKAFDAAGESDEYHSDGWGYIRKRYGSNCWYDSSIRQWLNTSGSVSYSHCPPSKQNVYNGSNPYDEENGFLSGFSLNDLREIKEVTHRVYLNSYDQTRKGYCDGGSKELNYLINSSSSPIDYSKYYYQNVTDNLFLLGPEQIDEACNNLGKNYILYPYPTASAVKNSTFKNSSLDPSKTWETFFGVPRNEGASYENVTLSCTLDGTNSTRVIAAYNGEIGIRPAFYLNTEIYTQHTEYNKAIENMLGDINLGPYALNGATIDIAGHKIPLVKLEAGIKMSIGDFKIIDDQKNNTVQVLLGYDQKASANIDGSMNSGYWSDSYREVKSMYQDLTGKKVDTTRLWNKYSAMRGKLKKVGCNLVVGVDATFTGFLEFKKVNGGLEYSDGGMMAEFNASGSFRHYTGPAYATLGIGLGAKGKLYFKNENNKINPAISVDPSIALSVGGGIGTRNTYAEIVGYGTLGANISTAAETPFKAYLDLGVKWGGYVLGKKIEKISGERSFAKVELYPNFGADASARAKSFALTKGVTVLNKSGYDSLIDSAEYINRDYLKKSDSSARKSRSKIAAQSADNGSLSKFEKTNAYPLSQPSLVSFNDDTALLVWIDDNGEKSDANKASLYYSYYNGTSWSTPQTLFEDRTNNDMPSVYSDGERAYIVWQRASKVFDDAADMSEMIKYYNLYETTFTASSGEFSDPIRINSSDNTAFEFNPVVYGSDGAFSVSWMENSDNNVYQESGNNTLYLAKYDSAGAQTELNSVVSTTDIITKFDVAGTCLYYSVQSDEANSLYYYSSGSSTKLVDSVIDFSGFDNRVYYIDNDSVLKDKHKLQYPSTWCSTTYSEISGLQDIKIAYDSQKSNIYLFTTAVNEDYTKDLYYCKIESETCTPLEKYSQSHAFIRNYSPVVLSDGTPYVAYNNIDLSSSTDYEQSTLLVDGKTESVDTQLNYVDFDNSQLNSESIDLKCEIQNNSSVNVNKFNFTVSNSKGDILSSGELNCLVNAFASSVATINIPTPQDKKDKITVMVLPSGYDDHNKENNTVTTTLECAHSYDETVVLPTCDAPGKITYVCKYCSDESETALAQLDGSALQSALVKAKNMIDSKAQYSSMIEDVETLYNTYSSAYHDYHYQDDIDNAATKLLSAISLTENFVIKTVSLSLESSITMNFKVFKNSLSSFDDFYMTFECGGKEEKVTNYKQDGNYYVFSYKGINPQLMNDKVTAVLHAKNSNGEYTSPEKVMSVREYAYTMLDRYSSDDHSKLRTLLVDLLNYGSATQKYVGYQTDNLANSDLTATQKSWASKDTKEFKNIRNFNYKTISNPTVQWNSCGLVLGNAIMFKVKFTANNVENKTVEITLRNAKFTYDKNDFKDNGDGTYYVYCNELFAHEVSDEVLLTVYENGVPCSNTMRFSIESYARLVRDNYKGTPLDEMITTMMLYGNSAKEYKNV
ncbi:DUF6273 domain-containing protein [Eubacterium coprostanoligenes]|uniref:CARDB protein n=1 Tax=Eubacterium coprostanoligenes TaxID=290054 RepID=A0A1T4KML6_9FIRM|nr:DUF6273 domain-containing protein [Eubacterium coprostanoligenes]SJZ43644.1 hypothetical protein SAMN02745114_00541 [Eubacterium coprostanoligenes]